MSFTKAKIKTIYKKKTPVALIRMDRIFKSLITHPRHCHPPLDLLYIESGLREQGKDAIIIDMWLKHQTIATIAQQILNHKSKIAIIKAYTWCINESIELGILLRKKNVRTIAVGQQVSHASVLWGRHKTFEKKWLNAFDIFILGEPDSETICLLEKLTSNSSDPNLFSTYSQRFKNNLPFLISNPNQLPYPQFTTEMMKAYAFPFPVSQFTRIQKWAYVQTSWGCPYSCSHCSCAVRKSVGKSHIKRKPELVVDEIIYHVQKGAQGICFEDDALFTDRSHILSICRVLQKRKVNISWMAHARPDELDESLLKIAAQSGLKLLKIGVESGSEKQIEIIEKAHCGKKWIGQVKQVFQIIHHLNIASIAMFMIGTPGETIADIYRSIRLAKNISPNYIQVQIFTPYPDSKYYQCLSQANQEKINTMKSYHYDNAGWTGSEMRKKQLNRYQNLFYRSFYLRSNFIIQFFRKNKFFLIPKYIPLNLIKNILKNGRWRSK
ncbi:radical SAM protein [Candidatus Magnetomorum sp. HK-1]|nr:radical SAM protein [Candidatus Magnetomorum sp. HK-1]